LNNFLKFKVYNLFVGKRCPICFRTFKKENINVSLQFEFNNTQKFLIKRPIVNDTIFISYSYQDDYIRKKLIPVKTRISPEVMCLGAMCDCGYYHAVELKVNAN